MGWGVFLKEILESVTLEWEWGLVRWVVGVLGKRERCCLVRESVVVVVEVVLELELQLELAPVVVVLFLKQVKRAVKS